MIEIRLTKDEARKLVTYGYVDVGQVRISMPKSSRDQAFDILVKQVGK